MIPKIEQRKLKAIKLDLLSKLTKEMSRSCSYDFRFRNGYLLTTYTYGDKDFEIVLEEKTGENEDSFNWVHSKGIIEYKGELVYSHKKDNSGDKVECFKKEDIWLPLLKNRVFRYLNKKQKEIEKKKDGEYKKMIRKLKKKKEDERKAELDKFGL